MRPHCAIASRAEDAAPDGAWNSSGLVSTKMSPLTGLGHGQRASRAQRRRRLRMECRRLVGLNRTKTSGVQVKPERQNQPKLNPQSRSGERRSGPTQRSSASVVRRTLRVNFSAPFHHLHAARSDTYRNIQSATAESIRFSFCWNRMAILISDSSRCPHSQTIFSKFNQPTVSQAKCRIS
jgi:hypothetical protein